MIVKTTKGLFTPPVLTSFVQQLPSLAGDLTDVLLTPPDLGWEFAIMDQPRAEEHERVRRPRNLLLFIVRRAEREGESGNRILSVHSRGGDGIVPHVVRRTWYETRSDRGGRRERDCRGGEGGNLLERVEYLRGVVPDGREEIVVGSTRFR